MVKKLSYLTPEIEVIGLDVTALCAGSLQGITTDQNNDSNDGENWGEGARATAFEDDDMSGFEIEFEL